MWKVPKIWEGGECWIIGGGPSIPRQFGVPEEVIQRVHNGDLTPSAYSPYLSMLHDKHVIAVNMSYLLGDWVDFIFFGDGGYYLKNRVDLLKFKKIKVSCNSKVTKFPNDGIKYLGHNRKKVFGISTKNGYVSWNKNSGAAAINFAYHLGAKKIYLLGFDMSLAKDNTQHWHSLYGSAKKRQGGKKPKRLPFDRHLSCFPNVAKDAEKLGLEIINCSPNSAITEFRKTSVKQVFNEIGKEKKI